MSQRQFPHQTILNILEHWSIDPIIQTSPHQGLINHTWLIGAPTQGVLQWVNPIFDARIHNDISALTHHLKSKGMATTELLPTKNGALYINDVERGYWRVLKYLPGKTFDQITSAKVAFEAGRLVGRFHNAMSDFTHNWKAPFRDAQNTTLRMNNLIDALRDHTEHPLYDAASALGEQILKKWNHWNGSLTLPTRVCHGDLKISNLHFNEDRTGLCLLDLDTIGPGDYSIEMGDAWRSWCNPAGESNPAAARFDLELFEASLRGWISTVGNISTEEIESLVPGIHRICLELSARFCADALQNQYFKEDMDTFPIIGSHNLYRATTQFRLSESVHEQFSQAQRIVQSI